MAKEENLPIPDLTSASLFGSMSNAFPYKSTPYHSWENNVTNESYEKAKLHIPISLMPMVAI